MPFTLSVLFYLEYMFTIFFSHSQAVLMINPKSLYLGLQPSFCFILVESATSSGGAPGLLGAYSTGKSTPVTFVVYPISPYTAVASSWVLKNGLTIRQLTRATSTISLWLKRHNRQVPVTLSGFANLPPPQWGSASR